MSIKLSIFNSLIGMSLILIAPLVTSQYLPINCAAVVLPAPEGPTKAFIVFGFKDKFICCNALFFVSSSS